VRLLFKRGFYSREAYNSENTVCAYERLRGGRALVENVRERTPMSVMAISERGS